MATNKPIPKDLKNRVKEINDTAIAKGKEYAEREEKLIELIINKIPREECVKILGISNETINRIINTESFRRKLKQGKAVYYKNKALYYNSLTPYERLSDVKRKALDELRQGYSIYQTSKRTSIGTDCIKYWIRTDEIFKELYNEIPLKR